MSSSLSFCYVSAHIHVPLFICKCVQLCVSLTLLSVFLFMSHCLCVKEKQSKRKEVPEVCAISVKHMVGRRGRVDSCVCLCVRACVCMRPFPSATSLCAKLTDC